MKKKSSFCVMKFKRILNVLRLSLFILILNSTCNLIGNPVNDTLQLPFYTTYKEVILKFLEDYSVSKAQLYPNQFSLVKKPDGWHAIVKDAAKNKIITDELFWSRQKGKYFTIDFPESIMANAASEHQNLITDWRNNYFTGILPYWGYAGWDKDVINDYEDKSTLSDTLLNALARAYASRASNLLNDNTGFSLDEDRFELPFGQNSLSEEQLATYRDYEHKSIECYEKLWQRNPYFETYFADIHTVYSNEVMNSFLTLLYHQNREEAVKELKEGLYDSFFKDMAKRYLASCDSNAILFVNGDNDTYPLLYVQEMEGFRKDVSVINLTMLSVSRYVSHLFNDSSYSSRPVDCIMDEEIYQKGEKLFYYINGEQEEISLDSLIEFVTSKRADSKLKIGDDYYNYVPSRNIVLNTGKESEKEAGFTVNLNVDYLLSGQFCLLDILGTNKFKRPVYFSLTVSEDNFLNLQKNFLCEGLTYRLVPNLKEKPEDEYVLGYIDTDLQYDKLMKDLNFQLNNPNQKYFEVHQNIIRNYRFTYSRLVKKLVEENKNSKALKVLDYISSEFSFEKVEPGYFSLDLIKSYYQLRETKTANALVQKLMIATLEDKIDEIPMLSKDDYETRLMIEILRQLEDITTKYVEDSVLNQDVRKKYYMVIDTVGTGL